jgi:hypothetical protein
MCMIEKLGRRAVLSAFRAAGEKKFEGSWSKLLVAICKIYAINRMVAKHSKIANDIMM